MRAFLQDIDNLTEEDEETVRIRLPKRYARAVQYRKEESMKQCIGAGALLLRAIGLKEEHYRMSAFGKPSAEGYPPFSISHSGRYVLLAVGDEASGEVGADVETVRPFYPAAARRIFSDEEYAWVTEDEEMASERFTILWTVKESVLKCEGSGFRVSAKEVDALPVISGLPAVLHGKPYFTAIRSGKNAFASVTAEHAFTLEWEETEAHEV